MMDIWFPLVFQEHKGFLQVEFNVIKFNDFVLFPKHNSILEGHYQRVYFEHYFNKGITLKCDDFEVLKIICTDL